MNIIAWADLYIPCLDANLDSTWDLRGNYRGRLGRLGRWMDGWVGWVGGWIGYLGSNNAPFFKNPFSFFEGMTVICH